MLGFQLETSTEQWYNITTMDKILRRKAL